MSLISSTTYAVETINHRTRMVQKQSMTKQDMQAMFTTNKVKVNSLDNGEMAKTEGEWLPMLYWLGGLAATAGWASWYMNTHYYR